MRKILAVSLSLLAVSPLFADVSSPVAESATAAAPAQSPAAATPAPDSLAPLDMTGRTSLGLGFSGNSVLTGKVWLSEKNSLSLGLTGGYSAQPAPSNPGSGSVADGTGYFYGAILTANHVLARIGRSTFISAGLGLSATEQITSLHYVIPPSTFFAGTQETKSKSDSYTLAVLPAIDVEYFLPSDSHLSIEAKAGLQGTWSHSYSSSESYINGTRTQLSESYSDAWSVGVASGDFLIGMNYYF